MPALRRKESNTQSHDLQQQHPHSDDVRTLRLTAVVVATHNIRAARGQAYMYLDCLPSDGFESGSVGRNVSSLCEGRFFAASEIERADTVVKLWRRQLAKVKNVRLPQHAQRPRPRHTRSTSELHTQPGQYYLMALPQGREQSTNLEGQCSVASVVAQRLPSLARVAGDEHGWHERSASERNVLCVHDRLREQKNTFPLLFLLCFFLHFI